MKSKNYKYYAKIPISSKTNRYFYSKEEYDAYKNAKVGQSYYQALREEKQADADLNNFIKENSKTYEKRNVQKKVVRIVGGKIAEVIKPTQTIREDMNWYERNLERLSDEKFKASDKAEAFRILKNAYTEKATNKDTNESEIMKGYNKRNYIESLERTINKSRAFTNPNYVNDEFEYLRNPENYELYNNNCSHCTAAFDLRMRGYDVEASPANINSEGYGEGEQISDIYAWYEHPDKNDMKINLCRATDGNALMSTPITNEDLSDIESKMISDYPEDSYGHFSVQWCPAGGHDMVWMIDGGKLKLIDCQSGNTYSINDLQDKVWNISYFRSDNLKINESILRTVVNSQDELQHHGIDGQRWGKRNGPPYPLDKETKDKAYKNRQIKKVDNKYQKQIDKLQKKGNNEQAIAFQKLKSDTEKNKILSMSHEDIQKERLRVGAKATANALALAGSFYIGGLAGVGIATPYVMNSINKTLTNSRLNNDDYKKIWKELYDEQK